jgi:hypothetical protein
MLHFDTDDSNFVPGSGAQPPEIPFETNNFGKHPRSQAISEASDVKISKQKLKPEANVNQRLLTGTSAAHRKSRALARHSSE